MDVLCFGLTVGVSIAAAVREKQLKDKDNSDLIYQLAVNYGAFASAAVIFLNLVFDLRLLIG